MQALVAISTLLYIFWPLIIFFGVRELFLRGTPFLHRIRLWLKWVFIGWMVWALFLGLIYWQGAHPILVMPPALDHLLFAGLGVLSGSVTIGWIIYVFQERRIRLSDAQNLEALLALSPEKFERIVAEVFKAYGHQTQVLGGSSDHGVDIIVTPNEGEKWVVQCKRYSGSVGEPIVRDLFGTMQHEVAQRAYLITTGSFTAQALEWAEGKPMVLYDGDALVTLIRRTQQRKKRS